MPGLCELGPLMRIEPYDYQYVHVQVDDCREIVEKTVICGLPVERLFYRHNDEACPHPSDIPFLNQQTRIVLENCGKIDAESIDEYISVGGFSAMAKAFFEMTPQVLSTRSRSPVSVAVAVQASRQARNGHRLHASRKSPLCSM